jgi:type III pantothenate kinase
MSILIGDIGNSVTKICLVDDKTLRIIKITNFFSKSILNKKVLIKEIEKLIKNKKVNNFSLFSSVVPKYYSKLEKLFKERFKVKLKEIKDKKIKKIVKIKIKNKSQVGSDRIANAVGVYKIYKENCIVLDFGTATTFDVITKNGIYNGGIIAPGINNSIKSLSASADQIPVFSVKKQKKVIGKNTVEALRSGFFWGYSGLINNIILKIEKETKKKYKIIFTGGYANLFKTSIIRPFKIDRDITIKGILEIYKINKKLIE